MANELRKDKRVINYEGVNIKNGLELPEKVDLCVVDLSFISLKLVLEEVFKLIHEEGKALVLVKPQFEAGLDKVGKKGVVKDTGVRLEVLLELFDWVLKETSMLKVFYHLQSKVKRVIKNTFFF